MEKVMNELGITYEKMGFAYKYEEEFQFLMPLVKKEIEIMLVEYGVDDLNGINALALLELEAKNKSKINTKQIQKEGLSYPIRKIIVDHLLGKKIREHIGIYDVPENYIERNRAKFELLVPFINSTL